MTRLIPFLVLLFSCGETAIPETEPSFIDTTSQIATQNYSLDPAELPNNTDTLRDPNHDYYLSDLPLRRVGQLMLADSINPIDNGITFRCMDSILSVHQATRDFFFPVFLKILDNADGALGEAVGSYTLQFVEKFPKEFAQRSASLTKEHKDQWSLTAGYELFFEHESKETANQWLTNLINNCKDCDSTDRNKLTTFGKLAIEQFDELNEN